MKKRNGFVLLLLVLITLSLVPSAFTTAQDTSWDSTEDLWYCHNILIINGQVHEYRYGLFAETEYHLNYSEAVLWNDVLVYITEEETSSFLYAVNLKTGENASPLEVPKSEGYLGNLQVAKVTGDIAYTVDGKLYVMLNSDASDLPGDGIRYNYPGTWVLGDISPNGKFLAMMDREIGHPHVATVEENAVIERITDQFTVPMSLGESMVFSPDDTMLVFHGSARTEGEGLIKVSLPDVVMTTIPNTENLYEPSFLDAEHLSALVGHFEDGGDYVLQTGIVINLNGEEQWSTAYQGYGKNSFVNISAGDNPVFWVNKDFKQLVVYAADDMIFSGQADFSIQSQYLVSCPPD